MELDGKTLAVLILVFGVLCGLFFDVVSNADGIREAWKDLLGDLFKSKEYWKDINWKDDEDDDEDDKTVNGNH